MIRRARRVTSVHSPLRAPGKSSRCQWKAPANGQTSDIAGYNRATSASWSHLSTWVWTNFATRLARFREVVATLRAPLPHWRFSNGLPPDLTLTFLHSFSKLTGLSSAKTLTLDVLQGAHHSELSLSRARMSPRHSRSEFKRRISRGLDGELHRSVNTDATREQPGRIFARNVRGRRSGHYVETTAHS